MQKSTTIVYRSFLLVCLLFVVESCESDHKKEKTEEGILEKETKNISQNNQKTAKANSNLSTEKNTNINLASNQKETEKKNNAPENQPKITDNSKNYSKVQKLLAKYTQNTQNKIQFAPLDNQIISNDTLFKVKNNIYELNYATSCANDSLVAQEMSDIQQQKKVVLLSHNYQTDIAFKVNGRSTTKKTIHKDLFKNKIEQDFLDKSIIKHPQFVRFDEAKNEAIFEFIVGVPNSDWLVIAAVNLSPQGNLRIIDIMMPEM